MEIFQRCSPKWYKLIRVLSVSWCAVLIALMATGTFSTARIGAMTWGPAHDVWSAAIALSQINFGLSGKLGYREIEQAIANEVSASRNVWQTRDDQTRALWPTGSRDAACGRALGAESAIVVPSSKYNIWRMVRISATPISIIGVSLFAQTPQHTLALFQHTLAHIQPVHSRLQERRPGDRRNYPGNHRAFHGFVFIDIF